MPDLATTTASGADEAEGLEPVDPLGHGATGDDRLLGQVRRGEGALATLAAQGREHVELALAHPAPQRRRSG